MGNDIVLSICIPTYNRAEKLDLALNALIKASANYAADVEILVSDNCSEDNTKEIIESNKENCNFLYYFRNKENLGFNLNMFSLVDRYAKGKFCWVLGDDDFVDIDALNYIIPLLKSNVDLKYLNLNFRISNIEEYRSFINKEIDNRNIDILWGTFSSAIDENTSIGNLLATFMSTSVFLREDFFTYPKDKFSVTSWTNFYSTFPNAYLMATLFSKEKVAYIKEPLITAIEDVKDWDDKVEMIFTKYIPQMYSYFLSLGIKEFELKQSYDNITRLKFIWIIKRIKSFKSIKMRDFFYIVKIVFFTPKLIKFITDKYEKNIVGLWHTS